MGDYFGVGAKEKVIIWRRLRLGLEGDTIAFMAGKSVEAIVESLSMVGPYMPISAVEARKWLADYYGGNDMLGGVTRRHW